MDPIITDFARAVLSYHVHPSFLSLVRGTWGCMAVLQEGWWFPVCSGRVPPPGGAAAPPQHLQEGWGGPRTLTGGAKLPHFPVPEWGVGRPAVEIASHSVSLESSPIHRQRLVVSGAPQEPSLDQMGNGCSNRLGLLGRGGHLVLSVYACPSVRGVGPEVPEGKGQGGLVRPLSRLWSAWPRSPGSKRVLCAAGAQIPAP